MVDELAAGLNNTATEDNYPVEEMADGERPKQAVAARVTPVTTSSPAASPASALLMRPGNDAELRGAAAR